MRFVLPSTTLGFRTTAVTAAVSRPDRRSGREIIVRTPRTTLTTCPYLYVLKELPVHLLHNTSFIPDIIHPYNTHGFVVLTRGRVHCHSLCP